MAVLGYNTAGSNQWGAAGYLAITFDTSGSVGGTLDSFHCSIAAIGSPATIKMGLYAVDSDGDINGHSLIEEVEATATVSDDVSISSLANPTILANTTYAIVWIAESEDTDFKYDTSPSITRYQTGKTYADMMDDPGGSTVVDDKAYSLWVEYTESSAGIAILRRRIEGE